MVYPRVCGATEVDGEDAAPVAFEGDGANVGAFIGRRVVEFTLVAASYDAVSGRTELSAPGQPSATVVAARIGNPKG